MGKSPSEKGINNERTLVPGVNQFPKWGGIKREGTPASIPDNKFWFLQNVRLRGGSMVSRGGQSKVNTLPTDGCIEGIFPVDPFPWEGPQYDMWLLDDRVGQPARMYEYDGTTLSTLTQNRPGRGRFMYSDGTALYVSAGGGSGGVYETSELRQIIPDGAGDITQNILLTFTTSGPGEQQLITTMASFDDVLILFVATTLPETQGGLYRYDGVTATLEVAITDMGSTKPPLVVVGSELLFPVGIELRRRNLSGTWDAISVPGAPFESLVVTRPYSGAEYQGKGYFVGSIAGGMQIFEYSGGSLTSVHTIAGASSESGMGGFSTFGSDLYFAYQKAGVDTIGKFDGVTWTDTVSTFVSGGATNALKEDTVTGRLYALRESSFDYTTDGVNWTQVSATGAEHLAFF